MKIASPAEERRRNDADGGLANAMPAALADHSFAKEFRLLCAACRRPLSAESAQAVRELSVAADWALLLALSRRHRVEGLVYEALSHAGAAPAAAAGEQLRSAAREIALRSLAYAAESHRVQQMLLSSGMPCLVLKGAAVEVLAYGKLGSKNAWDIDLLVRPEDAVAAIRRIGDAGYDRIEPPASFTDHQLAVWIELAKEGEFRRRDGGGSLELHWRLVDGPVLLPGVSVASRAQEVRIAPGLTLTTLADDELFSYLCVHGALHGWSRLKWLADLAAWLGRLGPERTSELYRSAVALGSGRSPAQALLLCETLFQTQLPSALSAELNASRPTRRLARFALEVLGAAGDLRELDNRPLTGARVLASHLDLVGDPAAVLRELRYRATSLHDRTRIPLPAALHFLYPLMRVPLFLTRRLARIGPTLARRRGTSVK